MKTALLLLALLGGDEDLPPDMAAMAPGAGRETTYYQCSACHAIDLVTAQKLHRERWDALLNWMVDNQGMAPPEAATRAEILDYLASHYGPRAAPGGRTRRR